MPSTKLVGVLTGWSRGCCCKVLTCRA